jgi:hypothetical protein
MIDIETQVRQAFAQEHMRVPETQIRPRVRRRQIRLALIAAAAIAVFAVAGSAAALDMNRAPAESVAALRALDDGQVRKELCDRLGAEKLRSMPGQGTALPETVVTFSDQGQWLNLYLGDRVYITCMGPYGGFPANRQEDPSVLIEAHVSPYLDQSQVWFDGPAMTSFEHSFQNGQALRIVAVPVGTGQAGITTDDGIAMSVVIADGKAVGWLPLHSDRKVPGGQERVDAYTDKAVFTLQDGVVTSRKR